MIAVPAVLARLVTGPSGPSAQGTGVAFQDRSLDRSCHGGMRVRDGRLVTGSRRLGAWDDGDNDDEQAGERR
ncbi:MAG: hypothetical protein ACRDRJ_43815 [Streptosporangiaceae bacterium]